MMDGSILGCMADPKQLEMIRNGATDWNKWRYENSFLTVDLSGADLTEANLSGTDLGRADLSDSFLQETVFANTDLKDTLDWTCAGTKGQVRLITAHSRDPANSRLRFSGGCGLPETLITYLPSLLNEPIQ